MAPRRLPLGPSLVPFLLLLILPDAHGFRSSSTYSSLRPPQQRRHNAAAPESAEEQPDPGSPPPLCLLHLAYDGGRYQGWTTTTPLPHLPPQATTVRPPKRLHPKRPPPPPTLHDTLAQALSVIHSKAPPHTLGLQAAVPTVPGVSARGAQLAFYRPPPPGTTAAASEGLEIGDGGRAAAATAIPSTRQQSPFPSSSSSSAHYPFGGDWARAAHSLNRILPDDLRVLRVQPPPWEGFDPQRDAVSGAFSLTVFLGVEADPTLRHQGWVLDVDEAFEGGEEEEGELVTAYANRIEAALRAPPSGGEAFSVLAARVAAARGPGVGPARARVLSVEVEVASPVEVDQRALVSWLGRVVRSVVVVGAGEPPLGALVLEGLVFREGGADLGGREWVVRDLNAEGGENVQD